MMEATLVRREIEIDAPASAVWRFVATADGMRAWWTSTRHLVLEERVGGRFELRVQFSERSYLITGRVLTYDSPRVFALGWREEDGDWGRWPVETIVTIRLTERNGRTHVAVEHSGFEQLPESYRTAALESYESGWTQEEMERLRALAQQAVAKTR
jgi:uncharacterized protein YndB with AHSA1/START domain